MLATRPAPAPKTRTRLPPHDVGLDSDACYAALSGHDQRFDGRFVTVVHSTGIYCRPSCPARRPRRAHVSFVRTPAAAQQAGYRACKRCRPDCAPGSPDWDLRADVASRAVRLIEDGVVDRYGVSGLAGRLGYSPRQLRRYMTSELGAGPLSLARAQRARTGRLLLETTDLSVADISFAAGFGSIRQCNETLRAVYAATPLQLRDRVTHHRSTGSVAYEEIEVRLPCRAPTDVRHELAFLGAHAIRGVESYNGTHYARSLSLPYGPAIVVLEPIPSGVRARLALSDLRDLGPAVARCRRLLDLDADPAAVDAHLSSDPRLASLVARFPGRRVVGATDGAEVAMRTLLGQQISLAAARILGHVLVTRCKAELASPYAGITHRFPSPAQVAALDPTTLPMPRARAKALVELAEALDDGRLVLDAGSDRDEAEHALLGMRGIGPWTAKYVRMRALGDPDVLLVEDLAARRAAGELGFSTEVSALRQESSAWAPWRSYGTGLFWAHALERMSVS